MAAHGTRFAARLGTQERVLFVALGCGVFLGLPLTLAVVFSVAFDTWQPLGLIVPFVVGFAVILAFRPTGYAVDSRWLRVLRPVGPKRFPLEGVREIRAGDERPAGATIGLARASGFYGVFGSFWNREWGKYYVYVTDAGKAVQLVLGDGTRLFVSPDDPRRFLDTLARSGRPTSPSTVRG